MHRCYVCTSARTGSTHARFVHGKQKYHKVKRKDTSPRDILQKTDGEGTLKQPLVVFWCLSGPWPIKSRPVLTKSPHRHRPRYKWHEAGLSRTDPGTSLRLDALICEPFLPCFAHRPFPGRPVEWATYPDNNTVWQRDLETDVPCHWRGAGEDMVPHMHTVCVSLRTHTHTDRDWMVEWWFWVGDWVVELVRGGG